jgi:competence protein ComEC
VTWHQIPFVRLLLPLIFGIVLSLYFPHSSLAIGALSIFFCTLPLLFIWAWKKKLAYKTQQLGAYFLFFSITLLGYFLNFYSDPRHLKGHFQKNIQENENSSAVATLLSEPRLKGNSVQAELSLYELKDSAGKWTACQGRIMASFELDTLSAALKYGDVLHFRAQIREVKGPENPHGFDPSGYLGLKGIYHKTYIQSNHWKKLDAVTAGNPLWGLMIIWRNRLSTVFNEHLSVYPNENAVASALVLGSRNDFSNELRNAYADTGATHVLSVSGLHVGLVATLLGWILQFFRKNKNISNRYNRREAIILILAIWFYVLLTGASASVLRSGLMFTFVVVGRSLSRKVNIYNSLSASAFFLICWQPTILWDIGFQLSYLALVGIVFFHPFIYKKIYIVNKYVDWAWNLTAVGIAAQISTLPLSLFYFHQFPSFFWLSGLAVIPLSTIALYAGIALLVFSWVPILSTFFGWVTYFALFLMNAAIFTIQKLPAAVISGFWLESWEMWLWYLVIAGGSMAYIYKRKFMAIGSTLSFLMLISFQFYKIYNASCRERLFVYKVNKGTVIDFISGQRSITLTDSLSNSTAKLDFIHKNNLIACRIRKQEPTGILSAGPIENDFMFMNSRGIGKIGNHSFAIPDLSLLSPPFESNQPLKVDFLIMRGNPKVKDLQSLEQTFDYRYLVFDASNSPYRLAKWRRQCQEDDIPYIDCSENGLDLIYCTQIILENQ